jgi:hypothetical protein
MMVSSLSIGAQVEDVDESPGDGSSSGKLIEDKV